MPDRRGRRTGVHVRPGAVRQARLEAGLSLAQVAGGEVSRNAIHLVEVGRTRPSLSTLRLIAQRTGHPVEYFLAGAPDSTAEAWADEHVDLVQMEAALARGDLEVALEAGRRLLEKAGQGPLGASVRLRLAEAHCRLQEPEEALDLLATARPALEAGGDEWAAIEALDWEAAARFLLEDPRAIDLLEDAQRRCLALEPPSPALLARVEAHLAMVHVQRHAWRSAIRAFESAVAHSTGVVDLLELAHVHTGLGRAYQEIGQPAKALMHASRAVALFELRSEARMRAGARNNLGELLLQEGQPTAAEPHIRAAVQEFRTLGSEQRGLGYSLCTLAEFELQRGNSLAALEAALESIEAGRKSGERVVIGMGHVLLGVANEQLGASADADAAFDQALAVLAELDQPLRLRDAHMRIAEICEARGSVDKAAAHWRTAAHLGRDHSTSAPQPVDWLKPAAV